MPTRSSSKLYSTHVHTPRLFPRSLTTLLQSKALDTLFDEIITNPAVWDPSGLLKLSRRVDPDAVQHGCELGCSLNMCKGKPLPLPPAKFSLTRFPGQELEAFITNHTPDYDRIIYVGDGENDFCPALRLRRPVAIKPSPCSVPLNKPLQPRQGLLPPLSWFATANCGRGQTERPQGPSTLLGWCLGGRGTLQQVLRIFTLYSLD